jgi:tRNA (guanine-N7-)-methyltransferase
MLDTLPRLRPTDAEIEAPPRPLWLEVGFGGGEHAFDLIAAQPDITLIACEVFENGICSLLSRLVPDGGEAIAPLPSNLRVWSEDARDLIARLPAASIDRCYLLFPDPWPKARHAKRRFVHPALLPRMAHILRAGAEWRIASDDPTYQAWVDEVFAGQFFFDVVERSHQRPSDQRATRYEAKAHSAGRSPVFWRMIRRGTLS